MWCVITQFGKIDFTAWFTSWRLGLLLGCVDNNDSIEHHQIYPLISTCGRHISVNLNFENTKSVRCTVTMLAFIIVHFCHLTQIQYTRIITCYWRIQCFKNKANHLASHLLLCLNKISLLAVKYWKYLNSQNLVTQSLFKSGRVRLYYSSFSRPVVSLQFSYIT